jgi:hypothetical protein
VASHKAEQEEEQPEKEHTQEEELPEYDRRRGLPGSRKKGFLWDLGRLPEYDRRLS